MQEEDKSVDIDTSGPDVEVELPQEKQEEDKKEVVVEQGQRTKHMKMNVKQNLKTVVSPVTHLRNLWSSLVFKKIINNKSEQ